METIEVSAIEARRYRVRAGGGSFEVRADETLAAELGAPNLEALVRASFEFLLERESVSSILPSFELTVIERYFPEWRATMRRRFR
jgi:hypothetical protein